MTTTPQATTPHPTGATVHLGGDAWTFPDLEHQLVDRDQITRYPGNPRRGDQDAITSSIRDHGLYAGCVVQRSTGHIVVGNHREAGVDQLGGTRVAVTYIDVDDTRAAQIVARDNLTSDKGGYDDRELADLLVALRDADQLPGSGYADDELVQLLAKLEPDTPTGRTAVDAIPDAPKGDPITQPGDLWLLGPHRILCADTTDPANVARLLDGRTCTLVHADPPYGMGKEAEGIANDNLYGPKLDAFQMAWWATWLPHLTGSASAYIWGTAPDLWRLWWRGGLSDDAELLVRNEIVWDKGSGMGMGTADRHMYPTSTERCLLLMRGQQFLGNQNAADFWEGYTPLLDWLTSERQRVGWVNRDINRITGTQMAGHWFTRSQFMPIAEHHYVALQQAAGGEAFTKPYDDLFNELFPELRDGGNAHRRDLARQLREARSYFDLTHDPSQRDVWQFPRVVGEERYGHATPKPVAMIERVLLSSSQAGDTIAVPFAGTCPEVIAGHRTGRNIMAMELDAAYVDTVCRRYQQHTGVLPIRNGAQVDFSREP